MVRKIFRVKPETYGKNGVYLPRALEFLKSVKYTQVIEDQRSERIQVRVEIKATDLKKMVMEIDRLKIENENFQRKINEQDELIKHYADLISPEDLKKLRDELSECCKERREATEARDIAQYSAERMNAELPRIQELFVQAYDIAEEDSPFRTFFNQEIKHLLRWPPLKGGLPGLGKGA